MCDVAVALGSDRSQVERRIAHAPTQAAAKAAIGVHLDVGAQAQAHTVHRWWRGFEPANAPSVCMCVCACVQCSAPLDGFSLPQTCRLHLWRASAACTAFAADAKLWRYAPMSQNSLELSSLTRHAIADKLLVVVVAAAAAAVLSADDKMIADDNKHSR